VAEWCNILRKINQKSGGGTWLRGALRERGLKKELQVEEKIGNIWLARTTISG